jgi:hypothetical protein
MEKKRREPAPNPNYTQSPNVFYDEWLREITSLSEMKVVEIVIRYTFGWHVSEVLLTLTVVEFLTGLSRVSAQDGVERAVDDGYIVPVKRGRSFGYRLNVETKETDKMLEIIQAVAFVKAPDGLSPEKVNLKNLPAEIGKESLPIVGKESKPTKKAIGKESLPTYKDKEKGKENRKKIDKGREGKTTTSSAVSQPINFLDSKTLITIPEPFPIYDFMREWAASDTPLLVAQGKLEAETEIFVSLNYELPNDAKPGARPPALVAVPASEWLRRWKKIMRKGEEFAQRDAKKDGDSQPKTAASKKDQARAAVSDFREKLKRGERPNGNA